MAEKPLAPFQEPFKGRIGKELVLGVVYNPDLEDMFWAVKGKGAYLNGKRLSVSKKDFDMINSATLNRNGYCVTTSAM